MGSSPSGTNFSQDASKQAMIALERVNRTAADDTLQTNIDAEIARAEAAESAISVLSWILTAGD